MDTYLYGCTGYAKVILDTLHQQGRRVSAIVDDHPTAKIQQIRGVPVLSAHDVLTSAQCHQCRWIVAIDDNLKRQHIVEKLNNLGHTFTTAIHPSASVGLGVQIGPGTVVMANAVIDADSQIGAHVIINTGATVGHDCRIDDYCHIGPGCNVCGNVNLHQGVLLEVGTSVSSQVEIGHHTTCGAGAVVIHSLPANSLAYGCPAQAIQPKQPQTI